MKVLVIIPAYNEQSSIMAVIEKLKKDCPEADYVVINDCSKDQTREVLAINGAQYIDLPLNLGIGGGVQTGYLYALQNGYDIAVQVDGDGQHDTAYLREMLQILMRGEADIVIGSRFVNREGFLSTRLRRMGITILSGLIKVLTGVRVYDATSGFRAVNRKFIELYAQDYPNDYPEPEAIVRASVEGAVIREFPVQMQERKYGESSINFKRSVYYMIKVTLAICLCRLSHKKRRHEV